MDLTRLQQAARRFGFRVKGAIVEPTSRGGAIGQGAVSTALATVKLGPLPVPCPYCHEPLDGFAGEVVRLVGYIDPRQSEIGDRPEPGLFEVAPAGTVLAGCGDCDVAFFVPAAGPVEGDRR